VSTPIFESCSSGRIPTNERLVEARLASQFGTSRTPIREALHKLELENLVSSIPRVGYVVKGLSEEDVNDICEIRSVIEGLAVKRAISQITEKNLERLKRNIAETRKAIDEKRMDRMVTFDTEFHDILCQSSGSKRIHELSQLLREYMLKFRVECLTPKSHRRLHRPMKESIRPSASEPAKAQTSIDDHLREVREDIINFYRSTEHSHA
jgi:DNA-binding GntR family transcriptional regulator